MRKPYFINVEFYNDKRNNFAYGITEADILVTSLADIARDFIKPNCKALNCYPEDFKINLIAFNNIE